jgi:hypothetical protein
MRHLTDSTMLSSIDPAAAVGTWVKPCAVCFGLFRSTPRSQCERAQQERNCRNILAREIAANDKLWQLRLTTNRGPHLTSR